MTRKAWRENWLFVLAFAVSFGLALFFGAGLLQEVSTFNAVKEQPLAPWMTPRYIAHSWDMPREAMMEILGLEPPGPGRTTIREIAAEKGLTVEAYIADIEAGIVAYRATTSK